MLFTKFGASPRIFSTMPPVKYFGLPWLQAGPQLRWSSESASRSKELVDALDHFVVLEEVAAVGGGDSAVNALQKLCPFQHAGYGFLDDTRRVLAFASGKLP